MEERSRIRTERGSRGIAAPVATSALHGLRSIRRGGIVPKVATPQRTPHPRWRRRRLLLRHLLMCDGPRSSATAVTRRHVGVRSFGFGRRHRIDADLIVEISEARLVAPWSGPLVATPEARLAARRARGRVARATLERAGCGSGDSSSGPPSAGTLAGARVWYPSQLRKNTRGRRGGGNTADAP